MKLCTLASGSKGNAGFVAGEQSSFLVDCGISAKRIAHHLEALGYAPETLDGIFLTHEHRDHILGLKSFLKKYRVPVFSTAETFDAVLSTKGFENMDSSLFHSIEIEKEIQVGDIRIKAFSIPHDAANPVGFSFRREEKKVAVCTDIGRITDCIVEHLDGSLAMILEANHDVHMVEAGRYPYCLKRRILSDTGHLSNENSGKLLTKIWNKHLKHVILGHLSEENNMPELALESVKCELLEQFHLFEHFTTLSVADGERSSELITV